MHARVHMHTHAHPQGIIQPTISVVPRLRNSYLSEESGSHRSCFDLLSASFPCTWSACVCVCMCMHMCACVLELIHLSKCRKGSQNTWIVLLCCEEMSDHHGQLEGSFTKDIWLLWGCRYSTHMQGHRISCQHSPGSGSLYICLVSDDQFSASILTCGLGIRGCCQL